MITEDCVDMPQRPTVDDVLLCRYARGMTTHDAGEYTPTTGEIRQSYTGEPCGNDDCLAGPARNAEFDRWLKRHDEELREEVARAIEGLSAWTEDASGDLRPIYAEAMRSFAARVARGAL